MYCRLGESVFDQDCVGCYAENFVREAFGMIDVLD